MKCSEFGGKGESRGDLVGVFRHRPLDVLHVPEYISSGRFGSSLVVVVVVAGLWRSPVFRFSVVLS